MFSSPRVLLCGVVLFLSAGSSIHAQQTDAAPPAASAAPADQATANPEVEAFRKFVDNLNWKTEGAGGLGSIADLQIPSGYRFTGPDGTTQLMEAYGNLTNGNELGYISPTDMSWFAVFEFSNVGYVKDDEKDKLDPDAILEQMKEGQKAANEELSKHGMSTLTVLGWQTPPFYNPQTNNLEWAIRLQTSDGDQVVNYKTKLLGRRGVMDVVLVCDEQQMPVVVPEYQKLLQGFAFKKEESYAAFTKGDKVAEYGLTGLIVGGGLLVAAKSGLLAKLWKPILVGIIAVGAFFKRIFVGKTKETI
ncbi:MAG: DUF2167 domain-containing protein [Verrucomicrobiaceae bacterium]|nr:MAG: DUF2167 domain-containing protein [Verrucomicrobiaceae bacterium]